MLDARTRQPLEGAEVELSLDGAVADEGFDRRRVTAKAAGFDFPFVRPGVAWLLVYRDTQSKLPYVVRLDIGRAGWQGAPIRLPAEVRIEGRIKPVPADGKIQLRGTRPGVGSVNAPVRADGAFVLEDIPPGPVWLSGFLLDYYARTIHFAGREVPVILWRTELIVPEAESAQLEISLSNDTGAVRGRVLDRRDSPVAQASVVLQSMPPKMPPISNQTGNFHAEKLPPGEYRMWACAGREDRVKVEAKATATATLRACDEP
ncbi:MAG: carboxypeptidase regulatory-like domain-containing protein [Acidobacteria bacterium]|nr:carboxypeptidase regulatory-like domain-containing protein [Acidobacteriota bacterium]